jgi:hypothetical protein
VPSDGPGTPDSPYVRARIIGGLALLALVLILGIWDAASTSFDFNAIEFALLLGTSLAMLGLEAGRWLLKP